MPAQPRLLVLLLGVLLGGGLVDAGAQSPPPHTQANTPTPTPASVCGPQAQHHSIEQLLLHTAQCQNSPDWLTHLGERLNAQGRYTEASEHLERALMLHPQHLGAAFAYSVALAGSGDLPSAVQWLAQLSTRADLPEPQRRQLVAAQIRMAQQPLYRAVPATADAWVSRASTSWRLGHDNNLLGAPRLDSLTLTLPSGDLTLPVNEANQPKPGSYQRIDARLEASHSPANQRRTDIALSLQHRRNPAVPQANAEQLEALAETHPAQQGVWGSLSLAALRTDGGTRYHSTSVGTGWAWAQDNACQSRLGTEWQDRRLTSNPVLSGRYVGVTWTWTCAPNTRLARVGLNTGEPGLTPLHWLWSVRLGSDTPSQSSRPGGVQHTVALRTSARWTQWLLEAELTHTQDSTGYSPLLSNNRVRHSSRALLRLEHHWPLHLLNPALAGWYVTTGLEAHVQRSNIPLFNVRSRNAYLNLRYQW